MKAALARLLGLRPRRPDPTLLLLEHLRRENDDLRAINLRLAEDLASAKLETLSHRIRANLEPGSGRAA